MDTDKRVKKFAGASFNKVPNIDDLPTPSIPAGYTVAVEKQAGTNTKTEAATKEQKTKAKKKVTIRDEKHSAQ